MRILICDDEPLIGHSIADHLGPCGFATTVFTSARDLMIALDRGMADVGLIITDLIMPDRDGLRLAEAVRRGYGIPVLLISSHILPFDGDDLRSRGLIGVLRKPLHLVEIERIALDLQLPRV